MQNVKKSTLVLILACSLFSLLYINLAPNCPQTMFETEVLSTEAPASISVSNRFLEFVSTFIAQSLRQH